MEAPTDEAPVRRRGVALAPLRHRNFALVWSAGLVSNVGTWMETVAVGDLVANRTGQAGWTALVAAAGFLPMGFMGTVADFKDLEAFRQTLRTSRAFGFMASSCIHPGQVPIINEEYGPNPAAVAKAERMIAAYDAAIAQGLGAVTFEGSMIDVPVVERARALLTRARQLAARGKG